MARTLKPRATFQDFAAQNLTWIIVVLLVVFWSVSFVWHASEFVIHALLLLALSLALVELARRKKKGLPQKAPPLFLTEFQVSPTWDFPRDFAIKDYSGLLLCQLIDPGTTDARLLAWWDSQASYVGYWEACFKSRLLLQNPVFKGPMVGRKSIDDEWWRKLKDPVICYSIFISLVAVGTNAEQVIKWRDFWFAAPDTEILSAQAPNKVVVDDDFTATITTNNHSPFPCNVELAVPDVSPGKVIEIIESRPISGSVQFGKLESTNYHLKVHAAGNYELRFSGKQKAGVVAGWLPLGERRVSVRAWDRLDQHPIAEYQWLARDDGAADSTTANGAVFKVTARHGHPKKSPIEYQATLTGDDLEFVSVQPGELDGQPTQAGGVAVIIWKAPAVALEDQDFELTVKQKKRSNENYWKKLSDPQSLMLRVSAGYAQPP